MSALTENRDTPEIHGRSLMSEAAILDAEVVYSGGMLAIDSADEVQMAADSAGLRVLGRAPEYVNNADDGLATNVEHGIFRYANSAASPVPRSAIGEPCFAADDQTVAGATTNYVAAGLVYDVDSRGVWVDQRPAALALARRLAPPVSVSTSADATLTAAEAFAGNRLYRCDNAAGVTLTLPAAVAGMRLGVQRGSATAGHDLAVQAATGDSILGSDAGKQVANAVDAVSQVLWLRAVDDATWIADQPCPADIDSWVIDNS